MRSSSGGANPSSLLRMATSLADVQNGECLNCRRRIERGEIDHFVPWSRYPRALAHNLNLKSSVRQRTEPTVPKTFEVQDWHGALVSPPIAGFEHLLMKQFAVNSSRVGGAANSVSPRKRTCCVVSVQEISDGCIPSCGSPYRSVAVARRTEPKVTIDDRTLELDVSDELDWDAAIDSHSLSVTASGGIVTITGNVRYYSQQCEVERLAESIAGVKGVVLRVQVDSSDMPPDPELALIAAEAVATTIDLDMNPIEMQVNTGWATMQGTENWDFQRHKIITAVGAPRGVRGITNLITISTADVPASKIKSSIESAFQRLFDAERQRIGVSVMNGEVTLTGAVTSGWQRALVTRSAWNAAGVRSVRNELVLDL